MEWTREPASFRDPTGFVFSADGILYRQISVSAQDLYRALIDSGLYAELVADRLLVAHEEVPLRLPDAPDAVAVIRPERIPFISYPYEWCFSQLKAAALLTLEVQSRALRRGLVLRDASAYNVQFLAGKPVFIDTLSFGPYVEGQPWVAYRQFCQHFLAPLALIALVAPSLGLLSRLYIDGVPLDLARRLLPASSKLRPGLLMHLHLHGKAAARAAGEAPIPLTSRRGRMGKTAMLGLINSLDRTVRALSWKPHGSVWSGYYEQTNYSAAATEHKQKTVEQLVNAIDAQRVKTVWDLGANTGVYSRIAARTADLVVSFDLDPVAVDYNYRACMAQHDERILPLVQDLVNPAPAIGWHHSERRSLLQRGPADLALALALVHHLVIAGNVPLSAVAAFFHRACRHLIIEFVPKQDSQVQRMLALRQDIFSDYSQAGFEAAFNAHFEIARSVAIEGTARTLYLMKSVPSQPAVAS